MRQAVNKRPKGSLLYELCRGVELCMSDEPDPTKLCEHHGLSRSSPTDVEIVNCSKLADYRVRLYSGKKELIEEGDPTKERDWRYPVTIEYLCFKHYEIKYRLSPPPTPKITFVRIKR